ncbi:MAG TPA: hypothetical protein VNO30_26080 [Kofleriaceae bacterium]|nr:hypothetical protein [Kofleriaceae bacterium]
MPPEIATTKSTTISWALGHLAEDLLHALPPSSRAHVEAASIPIRIGGRHVGDVVIRPGTDGEDPTAVEQLSAFIEWAELDAEISALGRHRLAIAAHAARRCRRWPRSLRR